MALDLFSYLLGSTVNGGGGSQGLDFLPIIQLSPSFFQNITGEITSESEGIQFKTNILENFSCEVNIQ